MATASLSAVEIARSLRAIIDDSPDVSVLLNKVTQIDNGRKAVITENGHYSYDSLVLATGAGTSYFV